MSPLHFIFHFILFFLLVDICNGVYGRVPGERYLDFLKTLSEDQRAVVRGIIFDPHLTKDQARHEVEEWSHGESPLTMQAYDRSQMDYEVTSRRNARLLNKRSRNYSNEGKRLDTRIREIYNNGSLTERQACDSATNVMKIASLETLQEIDVDMLDCDQIFTSIFD